MTQAIRRLPALLLALVLCLSLTGFNAGAAQLNDGAADVHLLSTQSAGKTAEIKVDTVSAKSAKQVSIPVKISSNPGIAGLALEIIPAKGMKLISVKAGPVLEDGIFTHNGNVISWYAGENTKKNGTLFTIYAAAPKKAGSHKVKIALKDGQPSNLCDEESRSVAVKFVAGGVKVAKLKAPAIQSVKAAKGNLTVKWKKVSGGSGYRIQLSTDQKFKKSVRTINIGKNSTKSYTAKKLQKGKYYLRICTRDGENTSGWSKTEKVRVK